MPMTNKEWLQQIWGQLQIIAATNTVMKYMISEMYAKITDQDHQVVSQWMDKEIQRLMITLRDYPSPNQTEP